MVENLPNEIWMVHPTYTDYASSNYGRIKSLERTVYKKDGSFLRHQQEQLIKPKPNKYGYLQFKIRKNGKVLATPLVHRFVYECMNQCIIPDGLEVNHKSEIKTENFIENLELLTHEQNINYGTHNEKVAEAMTNNPKISKSVAQYDLEGNLIRVWKSTMECGRNEFNQGAVASCCRGEYLTKLGNNIYKGFIWKYIEE